MEKAIIIRLEDETPSYKGYSDIVKFGNKYFRTYDAEGYSSGLDKITKKEYKRLLKYKKE